MKQETIEEAAERKYPLTNILHLQLNTAIRTGFQEGAKWQQEKMYSEEEVNEIIAEAWNSCEDNEGETFTQVRQRILEQFKKEIK